MKKLLFLGTIGLFSMMNAQNEPTLSADIQKLNGENSIKKRVGVLQTAAKLPVTLTPATQTIASGAAITDITASPAIADSYSTLDGMTGAVPTLLGVPNNGIYFDLTNSGASAARITGLNFATYTLTATTAPTAQTYTLYKTTTATTAVGNYTNSAAWTTVGTASLNLPATAANSGYNITYNLNNGEFVLAPGQSVGMYLVCNNPTANAGFKLAYRTTATTGAPVTDGTLTITHRVRGTELFQTDNAARGFYGNVSYYSGFVGYWERDLATEVTGSSNAGDADSSVNPDVPAFPISGTLTNTTTEDQTVTYTAIYFDADNNQYAEVAQVTVLAPALATDNATKNSMKVYPNPVSDIIFVSGAEKVLSLSVTDLNGRAVASSKASPQIDVRNLSKGVYLISITTDKGVQTMKFIKK